MMVVKTDQSSKEASWRQEYQRGREARQRGRHECHVMDIIIKNSGIVQAMSTKKAKMRQFWKEGVKVGAGNSRARGNQKGFLKARGLQSNGLFSLTVESSKEREEKRSGYTNVNEQECEKQKGTDI